VRAELEATLAKEGLPALAARLHVIDPTSAAVVDLQNPRRVIRALEVALSTGESFITQQRKTPPPFQSITFGLSLPRPLLYARIDARIAWMMRAGLVAETEALVAQGYGWELPAMSALGYKQIGEHLRGECTLDEAVQNIARETRRFVRRQANWFKPTDPAIHWVNAQAQPAEAIVAHFQTSAQ